MYPEDQIKVNWDLFITIVLLFACIMTPIRIAFEQKDDHSGEIVDYIVDGLFVVDMCIIFNTAFYDPDFQIIDDRK